MKFETSGFGTAATFARACGLVMLSATAAAAHPGHVVGTGVAASVVHALEHGIGALVIGAVGVAIAWRLRPERRRARRLVRHRDFT